MAYPISYQLYLRDEAKSPIGGTEYTFTIRECYMKEFGRNVFQPSVSSGGKGLAHLPEPFKTREEAKAYLVGYSRAMWELLES